MKTKFKIGDTVRFRLDKHGMDGEVWQITRWKVKVLFPIRRFVWLMKDEVEKVQV